MRLDINNQCVPSKGVYLASIPNPKNITIFNDGLMKFTEYLQLQLLNENKSVKESYNLM